MLASDEFPTYSMTQNGKLELRIEVPCNNTMLTLSKVPNLKEEEIDKKRLKNEQKTSKKRAKLLKNKIFK